MDYKKFWAIIDHENAVKERTGKLVNFNQKSRRRGVVGGWETRTYAVIVEFVDGDRTLIVYPDTQRRIVKTADLIIP